MGRIEYHDKSLIHVILASYSLILTKIYYSYRFCENSMKQENYKKIKEILAGSVGGSWAWNMVPLLKVTQLTGVNALYYAGAAKDVEMKNRKLPLSENNFAALTEWKEEYSRTREIDSEKVAKLLNDNLKNVFMVTLFLTVKEKYEFIDNISKKEIFDSIDGMEEVKSSPKSFLSFNMGKVDYSVLNFINNIFVFDEVISDFVEAVLKMIGIEIEKKEEIVQKLYQQNGFFKDMKEWHTKYGGMVVPVYATDFYYNLLKRLSKNQMTENTYAVEESGLMKELIYLLNKIQEKLLENDKFYEYCSSKDEFQKIFADCPFIKAVKEQEDEFKLAYEHLVSQLCVCDQNSFKGEFEKDFLYM